MTTEERLDALEHDLRQLRNERTILSDSIQVLNRAHDVHTNSLAAHADSLTAHAKWIDELHQAQAKTEKQSQETDARIDKLVSAIGEFIRQGKP